MSNLPDAPAPTPRPIKLQVLVRRDSAQDRVGALYLPQGSEEYPPLGTVVAVGGNVQDVGVGQRVMFRSRPGSALIPDAREGGYEEWKGLVMLLEEDILAVVEES